MANSALLLSQKSTNVRLKEIMKSLMKWGLTTIEPISPKLAASWAAQLFLTPYRYTRPARETELLKSAKRFSIDSEFGKLAVWSWGNGPIVLLVHGWEGRGAQLGSFIKPLVAAGYQVVAFDGPGHGESAGKRSSLVAMSRALVTIGQQLGPLAAIIAHSMGSAATTLAINKGLQVSRLIYLAPPVSGLKYVRYFAGFIGLSQQVTTQMEQIIEQIYQFRWSEVDDIKLVEKMSAPLLIFHDIDDRDVPWREGETLARAWPQSILITTTGLGHRRILHKEDIISSATAFINGDDDLYRLLLAASMPISQQSSHTLDTLHTSRKRQCATPDCQHSITDTLDPVGKYCSNCITERELYDPQTRWQFTHRPERNAVVL